MQNILQKEIDSKLLQTIILNKSYKCFHKKKISKKKIGRKYICF